MSSKIPERERRTIASRKVSQAETVASVNPGVHPRELTTSPELPVPPVELPVAGMLPPGSEIGQYELIRPVGRGGMGEVYLARDLRLGRLVAIKFLAEHSSDVNERFLVEAQATARCNHENIVVIHDVGEHGGRPYMVLEYVEGQTLSAWLAERARQDEATAGAAVLAPSLAVELMIPVVRALAYAHDLGVVHRDLKPANIMLTSTGTIKVLDFGIAKLRAHAGAADQELFAPVATTPGAIMGTLPYMSPEQLEGGEVDHLTDIWAVGIMLFEMVTGTHPTLPSDGTALPGALLDVADLELSMPRANDRRPDLGMLGIIIDRCLIKSREHRTSSTRVLLDELEGLANGRRAIAIGEGQSPFAGLAALQETDADRFFGRNRDIAALVARLRSQPLVAVAGPSGAGKSSLVRAGLIPVLKRSGEGWDAFVVRPRRRPLVALADVLLRLTQAADRRTGELPREPRTRAALCQQLHGAPGQLGVELRAWAQHKRRRVVLFVDQFEELYTLGTDPSEVAAFVACLDSVADDASSPLRVILSVRSDFLDRVAEHRDFMHDVSRGLYFLPPLDRAGLREALVRPIEALDYRYEHADMVESMLDEVAAAPGALPLLQFAASELWLLRDRERRLLTRQSYRTMGGIAGTLTSHADTVLAAMPSTRLARARAILERLVTSDRTRAIATMAELRELPGDAGDMEQVVNHLVDARLLVIEGEGEERTVELVHESLIHGWPTLARWLDENRDDAAFLARLRTAAAQWENSDCDEGMLWRGEPAREALAWRVRQRGQLGQLGRRERAYLDAVQSLATRTVRRRRQLVAGTMATLCMLLAAAGTALVWIQRAEAESRAQAALARANARTVEQQYAELAAKERELRQALASEQQARAQEESARREAAEAQRMAKSARREARSAREMAGTEAPCALSTAGTTRALAPPGATTADGPRLGR